MKLKQRPEDFQVEELTDIRPGEKGPFAFYRLEKRGLGTPEAVQAVRRRWRINPRQISMGGLKDRHAATRQYLSIHRGPRRGLQQSNFHLHYLGQIGIPYTSEQVTANRFHLTLRDLGDGDAYRLEKSIAAVEADGVANYFDDQRFGSVGPSRQFVARKLIDEDYEGALKLALTEPYEFDSAADREAKLTLRKRWGDWSALPQRFRRGDYQRVIAHLASRPDDFRGAVARLPAESLALYLSVYQSALWNRMLARWLEETLPAEQQVAISLRLGRFPSPKGLGPEQREAFEQLRLPLPSARLKLPGEWSPEVVKAVQTVMEEESLPLGGMKLKHFREPFFSKGDRTAGFFPENLTWLPEPDEAHSSRKKMLLTFDLPRGCYATILIKRITARTGPA